MEGVPTDDTLARRLLDDETLRERACRTPAEVIGDLAVDAHAIRAAGRHLDDEQHPHVGRARVALFHLAVARRHLDA